MGNVLYEIIEDGKPSKQLFLSEESARLWVNTHGKPESTYSVQPFKGGKHDS